LTRPRALVFGATRNSGLAAIRNLTKAGFDVIGADDRRLAFGLHSRYTPPYHQHPALDDPGLGRAAVQMIREIEPDAVVPISTAIVAALSHHVARHGEIAGVNVPPLGSFQVAADKRRMSEECERLGIPTPRLLNRDQAVQVLTGRPTTPVVVKPIEDLGRGTGVKIVNDHNDLDPSIEACRRRFGEALLQEFIPGSASAMRSVSLLYGRDSRLMAHFCQKKTHIWPLDTGTTALGETMHDPRLLDSILPFFDAWRWRGPLEVEFKIDERDGVPKVIEINPRQRGKAAWSSRFGAPFLSMAANEAAGLHVADTLPEYVAGKRAIIPTAYARVLMVELRRGGRRREMLAEAWSLIRHGAALLEPDLTDPLPDLGKILTEMRDTLRTS